MQRSGPFTFLSKHVSSYLWTGVLQQATFPAATSSDKGQVFLEVIYIVKPEDSILKAFVMDVIDNENVKPRSRTLTPKGKEYQMELVVKDLKHVRARLANHLRSFETLMRENDINGTKAELLKTDEVVAHLQTTVERQMDLFGETEETKKADLLEVLTAELESVKQVKKEVEEWLEQNRTLENEGSKTNSDEEVSALSGMIQMILKPDVSATKEENKERNQGEQEVVCENGNGESNMQITIEVMRLQMKLDNQVSLFDDLLDLKDVAMIKRELDRLER